MQKNINDSNFLSILFLIIILFLLSFIIDSSLVSRFNIDKFFAKSITSVGLLVSVIFLIYHTQASYNNLLINQHIEYKNIKIFLYLTLFFIFNLLHGITGKMLFHLDPINVTRVCTPSQYTFLSAINTSVFSPILETLLFVCLLPTLFIRQYRQFHPIIGIIFISILFSLFHFPSSLEIFLQRVLSGIFFCYLYYLLNSFWGALSLHIAHNSTIMFLDYFGSDMCIAIFKLSPDTILISYIISVIFAIFIIVQFFKKINTKRHLHDNPNRDRFNGT